MLSLGLRHQYSYLLMRSVRCFPTVLSVPIVHSCTQNIKYSVQKHVIFFLIHTLCLSGVVSYWQRCIEVGIIYARADARAVRRTRSRASRAQNEISYALCSATSASCCGWEYTINLTIRGATDHTTKAKNKKRGEKNREKGTVQMIGSRCFWSCTNITITLFT